MKVPGSRLASPVARARGQRLFLEHCALCHGVNADGNGVRREGFSTSPRNFTDPTWRHHTSPRHVFFVIREGVRDTAMPAWGSLSEEESWELVAFLLSVSQDSR